MDLKKRWFKFCRRVNAAGNQEEAFRKITAVYSRPPRFWHALETHITQCLKELASARPLADDPQKLELAIWLHDSKIVAGQNGESEFASADFAETIIELLDLRCSFKEAVRTLIMATRHCLPVSTNDEQLMVDIDLAILGKSQTEFDDYEAKVRQEYAQVPLAVFAQKRSEILERFLTRKNIYATEYFRAKYEARARENLRRSINRLKKLAR